MDSHEFQMSDFRYYRVFSIHFIHGLTLCFSISKLCKNMGCIFLFHILKKKTLPPIAACSWKCFWLYSSCACLHLTPFGICSFRSWRMPLRFTAQRVAALVHLSEWGMLICWIVPAHRRNPRKLALGRFYKMGSQLSIASPSSGQPTQFPLTTDLTVISLGEYSISPVHESDVVWIIVSHSWKGKYVL